MDNNPVTHEGVEYVEVLDNARWLAKAPTVKVRTSYFCGAACYAAYLKRGHGVFLKNTVVHTMRQTL